MDDEAADAIAGLVSMLISLLLVVPVLIVAGLWWARVRLTPRRVSF